MATSSKTRFALLGMLSIEDMSGYDIRREMRSSTNHFWSESDGQIYPTLEHLLEEDCVTVREETGDRGKTRKIYRITQKGHEALRAWLMVEPSTHVVRSEFMLQLFFGVNVGPEINLERIQAFRYRVKLTLAQFKKIYKTIDTPKERSPHRPYWLMTLRYGIETSIAKLKWCDWVINELGALEKGGE